MGADEPNFSPYVRLVSPTGRLIEGRRGTVAQISQRLTETGIYRVIVSSWNGIVLTGVGEYRLTLQDLDAGLPGCLLGAEHHEQGIGLLGKQMQAAQGGRAYRVHPAQQGGASVVLEYLFGSP